jgi:hypothetical protein
MPMRVLYRVLDEYDESRPLGRFSIITRETAHQSIAIGAMFIIFAGLGYIEESNVDIRRRDLRLGFGIGLTSFGIINGIFSAVMRNAAIRKYNAQFPKSDLPLRSPAQETGISEDE